MSKKLITMFLSLVFCFTAYAGGQRYLLHISNGKQEAIPLQKGEKAIDVIKRLENAKASYYSPSSPASTIDTIKYYSKDADLTTNFGYGSKDIALQWYQAQAGGFVKEFWWRQYVGRGYDSAGTVRAYYVNPRLGALPGSTGKWMGYYKDPADGEGGVTPYKPTSGDDVFYGPTGTDSVNFRFDPLGTESPWVPGGQSVGLLADQWQGLKLDDWGEPFPIEINQLFGFTLSNDTPWSKGDPGATAGRMELLSVAASAAPYHSFKWYEAGRNSANDKGWWWRPDYEWGMYVVVEYTTDRPPKFVVPPTVLGTTLKTTPREVTATITDDNPGGGTSGVASAYVFYKISPATTYDSVAMTATGDVYTGSIPGAASGSTVSYYVKARDVNGNAAVSSTRSYKIFAKASNYLFIYNNAQYSIATGDLIYTGSSTNPKFDRWSAPTDGTQELGDLLALYNNVLLSDGSFPSRNVYPAIAAWMKNATAQNPANLFFNSQDYGCYITNTCNDTTFEAGTFEKDYLGVETLGPQDLPPATAEFRMVPQADPVTNYLVKWETDSASTLWYYPTFELGFSGYQDAMTPASGAVPLFKSGDGKVMGVKNTTATTSAVFLGFDAGALQFRSDTSKAPSADPKYWWIVDVGSVALSYFATVNAVKPISEVVPAQYSLNQNYPNPFNPTTTIDYSVPVRSNVEIAIYNMLGQKVNTIVNESLEAGQYRATWNGKDSFGKSVASGVYFYSMKAGSFQSVKKMMLMK